MKSKSVKRGPSFAKFNRLLNGQNLLSWPRTFCSCPLNTLTQCPKIFIHTLKILKQIFEYSIWFVNHLEMKFIN